MKTLVSLGLSLVVGVATLVSVSAQAPAAAPAVTSKPGVYAETDQGTNAISAFYSGVATTLPVGFQTNTIAVPKAKTFKTFIVNMAGWTPDMAALYWVNGLTDIWAAGNQPIKSTTSTHTGGFSITTTETAGRPPGFVLLAITPGGTGTKKFYAVNLGKNFALGNKPPTQ